MLQQIECQQSQQYTCWVTEYIHIADNIYIYLVSIAPNWRLFIPLMFRASGDHKIYTADHKTSNYPTCDQHVISFIVHASANQTSPIEIIHMLGNCNI
jgi:hypothetical protein